MQLSEIILPNEDFQTSVNIDYDFGNEAKIESLVMTNTVSRYMEELLRDVITSSNQRSKLLVGAYGKGKSHIVLAALNSMWNKDSSANKKLAKDMSEKKLLFAETYEEFATKGARLLPVIISGNSTDLQRSFLHALRNALRRVGLGEIMPSTNFDAALAVLKRWDEKYPDTYKKFEELAGVKAANIQERLAGMDVDAYQLFVETYPELTAGSSFDELDGANAIDVYTKVLEQLSDHGISGIYAVYDEFSKYLEASIAETSASDIRFLQDFAEQCNRSEQNKQMHLLLISHKSLENYIESKLSKDKADGWRGVSGRFREIVMIDDFNQYYELIERAINKDSEKWDNWLKQHNCRETIRLKSTFDRYASRDLFIGTSANCVYEGSYPLHPLAVYMLPRMSERVAQNERTLFTFLCGKDDNSLAGIIEYVNNYVMPDQIYDYFEPQLRKEFYTSPLHRIYELAKTSLSRVDGETLEAKIIKTIAAIDVLAQYDRIAPTKAAIIELYCDDGYTSKEVSEAISNLVDLQSIVYLKRSNSFLKLKESSGVKVDAEITERAETIRQECSIVDLLNKAISGLTLYPSAYNDEHRIVRFFTCRFVSLDTVEAVQDEFADGEVLALLAQTANEMDEFDKIARDLTSQDGFKVVAVPKKFFDISDAIVRHEAAKQLKEEAGDDAVLAEEYELAVEDYAEIVEEFVASYFQPEFRLATYYINGNRQNKIRRKHQLSERLSRICEENYPKTPRITSEALNKNKLTGTAFSSRTRILKAICANTGESDLGFVGNGQETSMMRSALQRTGVTSGNVDARMQAVLDTIDHFLDHAAGNTFEELYKRLTGRDNGIGMREGPIPLYLAWRMKDRVDELEITHRGEEKAFNETLLDDISRCPGEFEVTRVNWTPEMASFTRSLADIFGVEGAHETRTEVADAIRMWFIGLPQVVRNSKESHVRSSTEHDEIAKRQRFFKAIKQLDTPAEVLLFEKLPKAFNAKALTEELLEQVKKEKEACDTYLTRVVESIAEDIIKRFEPDAPMEATLGSVLHNWIDENPSIKTMVFNGADDLLLKAMLQANGDDAVTVQRMAKAATSLRIEDWNDSRFDDFFHAIEAVKSAVEDNWSNEDPSARRITITFTDEQGDKRERVFSSVDCNQRAKLLHNGILACLAEMGGALQPEEKRQVVFDVLKELC